MGEWTQISWCDHTFNPWEGCAKVSPGCAHCYAETRNHRFGNDNWGKGKPRRRTSDANWKQPLRWNDQRLIMEGGGHRRPRVFCASLADWLDDDVPIGWLADLLKLIHDTPNLDWLLLTKRPENWYRRIAETIPKIVSKDDWRVRWLNGEAPDNVWIGTSVEDQQRANERIPHLLSITAPIHFLSVEPMLEQIDFCEAGAIFASPDPDDYSHGTYGVVDWIIFGGESGPKARPCVLEWIRDGVWHCRAAGIAPFVKQLGARPMLRLAPPPTYPPKRGYVDHGDRLELKDKKGADPAEWPEDLRVREFPA